MKEAPVEEHLRMRLEGLGFKVLKLITPGHSGSMDRLLLRPKWSPGAPYFVECKRPKKTERLLQAHVRDDWRSRGVLVLDVCDTYQRVNEIERELLDICQRERIDGR